MPDNDDDDKRSPSSHDDLGFDAAGNIIAIGDDAQKGQTDILDHPDARLLVVMAILNGDVGIRTFGPPSWETADLFDLLAKQYRQAVAHALGKPQG